MTTAKQPATPVEPSPETNAVAGDERRSTIDLLLRRWEVDPYERRWRALGLVLLLGLLVRLWAMQFPPFPIDMADWIAWGERIRNLGPAHFYADGVFADYAPGYLYVLWGTAVLKHLIFPQDAGADIYHTLFRLPPILCDLATAGVIFLVVDRFWPASERRDGDRWPIAATLAAAAYALNPAAIFNSAAWGQVDSTYTLLMLLTVLLLGVRAEASVLCYVLALIVKPQAISLAPLMVVGLLMRYAWQWQTLARAAGLGLLLTAVLLYPFFGTGLVPRFITLMRGSADAYPYSSLNAYNFWGIYGFWKADSTAFVGGLSLFAIGILFYGAGIWYGVVILEDQLRRKTDFLYTTLLFAIYFIMLPFAVLTRMHERYIHPVMPFLLLFGVLCLRASKGMPGWPFRPRFAAVPLVFYGAVTLLYTISLYYVYTFYRFFDTGVPASYTLFHTIEAGSAVWSALLLFCFWTLAMMLPWWLAPGLFSSGTGTAPDAGGEPAEPASGA